MSRIYSPDAFDIVGINCARQHLRALGRLLFPLDRQQRRRWVRRQEKQLDEGRSSRGVKLGCGRQFGTVVRG